MCGIVGYTGSEQATPILLKGLGRLEYRGYDSAGIAVIGEQGELQICKAKGRLSNLEDRVAKKAVPGTTGIAHTRWATHGEPSDVNAHPHFDENCEIAVVHNGIIENYLELKEMLIDKGYKFRSETDTEVMAHLLRDNYNGNMLETIGKVIPMIKGSYAFGIVCKDEPDTIYCTRKDSQLIVGKCEHGTVLASDIPAILEYTRDVYLMEESEIAKMTPDDLTFYDLAGNAHEKKSMHVDWNVEAAEKGGYEHFMLKEIHEQPDAIRNTLMLMMESNEQGTMLRQDVLKMDEEMVKGISKLVICACGTAYHAGLVGKLLIEKMAQIPVDVEIASEYRYRDFVLPEDALFVVVSQSGETADTIAALREAKRRGVKTLSITNVVGSTVAREADHVLYTWAGPEIAVASTKAFVSQLMVFYVLAAHFAEKMGRMTLAEQQAYLDELLALPAKAQKLIDNAPRYEAVAKKFYTHRNAFYIGRNVDNVLAMEAALKLKEISYIQCEAYPAGELKHGTLSLVEDGTLVIAIATQTHLVDKTINNIKECAVRGAYMIAIAMEGDMRLDKEVQEVWEIPSCPEIMAPALVAIPAQLFGYYMAHEKGCDIDKPRNLAKSVTVE
ncbi:MAG: glutamine--fructose-6-phosphate transaminase (isomerizing) [Christensenellales bacterium]